MSKQPIRPRVAPLVRVVATEITDPAERAALDEAHRRARERRLARKGSRPASPLRILPLMRVVATEITDPAEIAALLEASRRAHPERSRQKGKNIRNGKKARSKTARNKAR